MMINTASIYGGVGDTFNAALIYALKGGVVNLKRSLVVECTLHSIYVNAIIPGFLPSEMTQGIFEKEETTKYIQQSYVELVLRST